MSFTRKYGSRQDVFELGIAEMTRGGLRKDDLMLSRTGKIVSIKKSKQAKENYAQYGFKKRETEEAQEEQEEPKKKRRRRKRVRVVTPDE